MRSRLTDASLLLAVLLLVFSTPGNAQNETVPTAGDRAAVQQCLNAARQAKTPPVDCIGVAFDVCQGQPEMGSTAGMADCARREEAVWDELLNASYGEVRGGLSKNGKKILRDIQRVWIKWRDVKCELPYAIYEGGSIARVLAAECRMRATALRAIELGDAAGALNNP